MPARKPTLQVLVGDGYGQFHEVLRACLQLALGARFDVRTDVRTHAQDLVIAASRRSYDLFVLVLNNIRQRGLDNVDPLGRILRAAELVPFFKRMHRRPVVVLVGGANGPTLHWLEQVGADVILGLPFTGGQFCELVSLCVKPRRARPTPERPRPARQGSSHRLDED